MNEPSSLQKAPTPVGYSFVRRFLHGEAHFGFWMLVKKGFGVMTTLLILSSLTLYEYGVFQLLLALSGALAAFFSLGGAVVMNDVSRHIAEGREGHAKRLFYEYSGVRVVLAILVWAGLYFGASLLAPYYGLEFIKEVRLISFIFLIEVFNSAATSLLSVRLQFAVVAQRAAFHKFVLFCLIGAVFIFSDIGLKELLLALPAASLIATGTFLRPIMHELRRWVPQIAPHGPMLLPLFRGYGKWDVFRQFFAKLISSLNPWLIKIFISTEAVALYSVATMIVSGLSDLLPIRTLPSLIPLHISDRSKSQRIFSFGVKYLFLLSILLIVGAALIVPAAAYFVFTQYLPVIPYFLLMLLSIPISALGAFMSVFILSLRKQKFLFIQELTKSVIMFTSYLILVPPLGLWGVALERFITPLAVLMSSSYYLGVRTKEFVIAPRDFVTFGSEDKLFIQNMWRMVKNRKR